MGSEEEYANGLAEAQGSKISRATCLGLFQNTTIAFHYQLD